MALNTWTQVDQYITDLFVPPDPVLEAVLQTSAAAGMPPHHVSPNQGKLLMLLARIQGARNILEIGTLGGYSTIWLARALPADGNLITLEANPQYAEVAQANITRAGLDPVVQIRLGRAVDTLPQLLAEGHSSFDLIFIDADKPSNPEYLAWALRLAHRGTLIIADNVVRGGAVSDAASRDPGVEGIRRFNELLAIEPRASATAVQAVGSKGYDGFAIALVTGD